MILCFNKKINSFCKNSFKSFNYSQKDIQDLMPSIDDISCECPSCGAKNNFSVHAYYGRNLNFVREDKTYAFNVTVTRVKCNSCNHTHALLPSFVVPYKSYSRDSILHIVAEAFASSVHKAEEKFQLYFQMIYALITVFMAFFDETDSLNKSENLYKNFDKTYYMLNSMVFCRDKFNILYFDRYQWGFLMTKFRNTKSPPIKIGVDLPNHSTFERTLGYFGRIILLKEEFL